MKEKLLSIIKFFKKAFIVFIITSIIVVIISKLFHFELSNMFLYVGVIYMIIGVSSAFGSIGSTFGIGYIQAQSISKSVSQNAVDNFKDRDNSYDFLIFMCVVGFLLLMIGLLYSKN